MSNPTIDAERSVLGGILISCEQIPPALALLSPGDFLDPKHGFVFEAMLKLDAKKFPIDAITVRDEVKALPAPKDGWAVWLAQLTDAVPTAANIEHWAKIVRREALRRDAIKAMSTALENLKAEGTNPDDVIIGMSRQLGHLEAGRALMKPYSMRELVRDEYKAMQERASGKVLGLPTGFRTLDNLLGGLEPGGVSIIAGRPSMGKSALATNMAQHIALRGEGNALLFSLEMDKQQQAQRAIASEGRVDLNHIRGGKLNDEDWARIATACGQLSTDRLAVVDGVVTITEIRAISRAYHARNPLSIVVVDYIQLVPPQGGETREQEVAAVSRGLKALAMELKIPVVALSQLNRGLEQRQDKRPMLSDLRESGALEQDASQVMLVYRDEYYNKKSDERGVAEVIVAKNRNGPVGTVRLRWASRFTRFDSIEQETQTPLPFDSDQPGASA